MNTTRIKVRKALTRKSPSEGFMDEWAYTSGLKSVKNPLLGNPIFKLTTLTIITIATNSNKYKGVYLNDGC